MSAGFRSAAAIQRPNNTTNYSAGAVIGPTGGGTAAFQLADVGPYYSGFILVTKATLLVDVASLGTINNFRLHLYNALPPSGLADGAVWSLVAEDRDSYLDYLDIGTPQDFGATLFAKAGDYSDQYRVPHGGALWAYLMTVGAITTPPAEATFRVMLNALEA